MRIARDCKQVVEALGGATRFSELVECSRTSPYNYIARGSFPREVSPRVLAACGARRIAVPIALFDGLTPEIIRNMVAVKLVGTSRKGGRDHG